MKYETRAFRGGSWYDATGDCRASDRHRYEPGARNFIIGFRVLQEITMSPIRPVYGGAWGYGIDRCATTVHYSFGPKTQTCSIGFRVRLRLRPRS